MKWQRDIVSFKNRFYAYSLLRFTSSIRRTSNTIAHKIQIVTIKVVKNKLNKFFCSVNDGSTNRFIKVVQIAYFNNTCHVVVWIICDDVADKTRLHILH